MWDFDSLKTIDALKQQIKMHIGYLICPTYTARGNAHSEPQISGIDLQQRQNE